jgi:hypothetical protein
MGPSSQSGPDLEAGSGPGQPGLGRRSEGGRSAGWSSVLDRYGVQYLILDKERDGGLLSLVRTRPGWAVDFEDGASVLFVRSPAGVS